MRRLAGSLGIRAPSLYKHLPDKAALEALLIAAGFEAMAERFEDAETEPGETLAALAAAYRALVNDFPVVGGEDIRDDVVAVVAAGRIRLPTDGDGGVIRSGSAVRRPRSWHRSADGLHVRRTGLARPTPREHGRAFRRRPRRRAQPRRAFRPADSCPYWHRRAPPRRSRTRCVEATEHDELSAVRHHHPHGRPGRTGVRVHDTPTPLGSSPSSSPRTSWSRAVGVATPAATTQATARMARETPHHARLTTKLSRLRETARWRHTSTGTGDPKPTSEGHVPVVVPIVAGDVLWSRRRAPPSRPSTSSPNSSTPSRRGVPVSMLVLRKARAKIPRRGLVERRSHHSLLSRECRGRRDSTLNLRVTSPMSASSASGPGRRARLAPRMPRCEYVPRRGLVAFVESPPNSASRSGCIVTHRLRRRADDDVEEFGPVLEEHRYQQSS